MKDRQKHLLLNFLFMYWVWRLLVTNLEVIMCILKNKIWGCFISADAKDSNRLSEMHWGRATLSISVMGKYSEKDRGNMWTSRNRITSYSFFLDLLALGKLCYSFFGFSFKRIGRAFTDFFITIFHYPCCCSLLLKHTVTEPVVPAEPNNWMLKSSCRCFSKQRNSSPCILDSRCIL